jgi:hypothetical protein
MSIYFYTKSNQFYLPQGSVLLIFCGSGTYVYCKTWRCLLKVEGIHGKQLPNLEMWPQICRLVCTFHIL